MRKYLIEDSTLTGIADAIREKVEIAGAIAVSDMATRISEIESGIDVSDATVTAENLAMSHTAYGAKGKITGTAPFVFKDAGITPQVPHDDYWDMAYGNGRYVAVGRDGTAAYSDDGIVWTAVAMPTTETYIDVCFGKGRFVAFEYYSDSFAYSSDGIQWTVGTLPSSSEYHGCFGNDKFVATGLRSILYSSDGITWSTQSSYDISITTMLSSVCYGGGKFIALGSITGGGSIGLYSSNGTTWTKMSSLPSDTSHMIGVCYGNGRFVCVPSNRGYDGVWSADGNTWTFFSLPATTGSWDGVRYENGVFVAYSEYYSTAWSVDGVVWTLDNKHKYISTLGCGGGKFVMIYEDYSGALSTDGINWFSKVKPCYELVDTSGLGIRLASDDHPEKTVYVDDKGIHLDDWAGSLTLSGSKVSATYVTEAGCSLAVDPIRGMAFVTIQGGTSSSYENIYFQKGSLPSGVTFLTTQTYGGPTSGSTSRYFTAAFTGITGKINVEVVLDTYNGTYDYVTAVLNVTYV